MDFLELAALRKSVRAYENKPVPKELLGKLMQAAILSPSAGNLQPWHFYVVTNSEALKQLNERCYPLEWFSQAPAIIAVAVEPETCSKKYHQRGAELYCFQDTAAAIQNILLCAADLGLGTCWMGAFNEEACAEVLGLPNTRRPIALIAVGYPATQPNARPRKPIEEVVTFVR